MKKKGKKYVVKPPMFPKKTRQEAMMGKWYELAVKQNWRCYYCNVKLVAKRGRPDSATSDHRIPRARGGRDSLKNLVASCSHCNDLKADMTEDEFMALNESFEALEEKEET